MISVKKKKAPTHMLIINCQSSFIFPLEKQRRTVWLMCRHSHQQWLAATRDNKHINRPHNSSSGLPDQNKPRQRNREVFKAENPGFSRQNDLYVEVSSKSKYQYWHKLSKKDKHEVLPLILMLLSGMFFQKSVHPMVYAKRGETTSFK